MTRLTERWGFVSGFLRISVLDYIPACVCDCEHVCVCVIQDITEISNAGLEFQSGERIIL